MDALYASFPNPLLKPLVSLLVNNGTQARKSFLSLCRYQGLPTDLTSPLYDKTKLVIDLAIRLVDTLQTNGILPSNEDAWTTLDITLSSPVFSGVMIYALSIHPYASEEEELDILLQLRLKEKDVIDSRQPYSRMNFNVWSGDIDGRLHPDIKPNPRMAYTIGSAILATFQKFQGTVLFPYPGDFVDYIGSEAITPVLIEYSQGSRYAGRRRRYHVCKPIPDWAWNGEIVEFFGEVVSHDEYKVSLSEIICSRVPERITLYSLQMVLKRKRNWMNTFVMMTKTTMYLLRYSFET